MTISTDSILQAGLAIAAVSFGFNVWYSYKTGETFSGFILVYRNKQPKWFSALIIFNAALAFVSLAVLAQWMLSDLH